MQFAALRLERESEFFVWNMRIMLFIIFETHLGVLRAEHVKNKTGREKAGFPGGSNSKESTCIAGDTGDLGLIPGSGRSPGGNGIPVQYSCLENPTDRQAWWTQSTGSQIVRHD